MNINVKELQTYDKADFRLNIPGSGSYKESLAVL